jgi:hypothetical protein
MASVRVRAAAVSAVVALSAIFVVASAPAAAAAVTVTVTPSTGLADGQPVTITGEGFAPNTSVGTAECSAAVATSRNTSDCDLSSAPIVQADQSGTAVFHLRAKRTITTQNGTVDCLTAAQPCVIGVADVSNISDPATSGGMAISFDANAPPPPPPDVTVLPASDLLDRQQVAVYATGFLPGEQVIVGECTAASVADSTCDPSFGGAFVSADPVGAVGTGITVRRALRTPAGRLDCASAVGACVVMARAVGGPAGTADMGFDPSVPLPPPPTIAVTPSTGLGDRYRVTVTGAGFLPNSGVSVVECPSEASTPFTCSYENSRSPFIAADGTFSTTFEVHSTLDQYVPAQPGPVQIDCTESAGRCVLLAAGYEDPANVADAPLTFDPNAPAAPPPTATASPSTALVDGQTVHVTADGFPPGGYLYLVQCVAGSTDATGCDVSHLGNPVVDDNGHLDTDFVVHRVLTLGYGPPPPPPTPTTAAGVASADARTPAAAAFFDVAPPPPSTFDCASAPGACTLAVAWLGNTIEATSIPLTFDTTALPDSSSTDTTAPAAPADGRASTGDVSSSSAEVQGRVISRTPLPRTGTDVRSPMRLDLVLLVAGSLALVTAAAVRARAHRRA